MKTTGKYNVGVVVVAYNSESELPACLKAVKSSTAEAGADHQLIVVDNNSKDSSVEVSKKGGAVVIENSTNFGFAKAVNQGIAHALQYGASHALILNPDSLLSRGALKAMLDCLQDEQVAAVGPRLVDVSKKDASADYYLKIPSWPEVLFFHTVLRRYFIKSRFWSDKLYRQTGLTKTMAVEHIPGACLLIKKEALDSIGLLDEDYSIWFEDVDWSYRARRAGFSLMFCSEAEVEHEGSVTFKRWDNSEKTLTFYVSMKTFFNKHKPLSGILVRLVVCLDCLALLIKKRDFSYLRFMARYLKQKRGLLPE